jgi:hypothetical protein
MFSVPSHALRAVALCAAVGDIRYYLNGVCAEVSADRVLLIGTNGHLLGAYRVDVPEDSRTLEGGHTETGPTFQVIIPADVIARLSAKSAYMIRFERCNPDDGMPDVWAMHDAAVRIEFKPIEGKFPDFRRVAPRGPASDSSTAQFDPRYIATFAKIARILGSKGLGGCVTIGHRGNNAAVVSLPVDDRFTGVLMPLRCDDVPTESPEWLYAPTAEMVAQAAIDAIERARGASIPESAPAEASAE